MNLHIVNSFFIIVFWVCYNDSTHKKGASLMKKLLVLLLLIFPITFLGCSGLKDTLGIGEDTSPTSSIDGGSFVLNANDESVTEASNQAQGQSVINNDNEILKSFGIGDVKSSIPIFFSLSNGGNSKVTTINISSSASYLEFTPNTIYNLDIKGSGDTNIIQVGIIHGVPLNGIGYTELISMGDQTPTFSVTGYTSKGDKVVTVSATYELVFNAKVAAFKLFIGGMTKDITVGDGRVTTPYGNLSKGSIYYINNNIVKIQNTGNVDLNLRLLGHESHNTLYSIYTVPQGQVVTINTPLSPFNQWIEVDGSNAVFDFSTYDVGSNGKVYFELLD